MRKPHWSFEEIELLRKYYSTADSEYLKNLFPNRSYEALLHKANRLRLRRVKVEHYLKPRTVLDLPIEKRAYLAGLIDGEGAITIAMRRGGTKKQVMPGMTPLIGITNSNRDMIAYIQNLVRGSTIKTVKQTSIRRTVWTVQIARLLDIEALLEQILPYLVAKKRQAELVLEYCKTRKKDKLMKYDDRLFEIAKEVRELNKKGPK